MALKAVGFDLDGTLYPAWAMYAITADLGLRHPRFLSAFGRVRKELRHSPLSGIEPAQTSLEAFRKRQAGLLAGLLGIPLAEAINEIERIVYKATTRRFAFIKPYADLGGCLAALKTAGLKLGVLSDLPCEEKLKLMGLADWFEIVRCSEDSGALKPDPRPFMDLADAFDLSPDEILYVGNKPAYDIAGAKAAGMSTALRSGRSCAAADLNFRRWSELAAWTLART